MLGLDKSFFNGIGCQFGDVMHIEFADQVGAMFLNCFDTDVQKFGDFLVGMALCQEFQYFSLPLGNGVPSAFLF